MAKEKTNKNIYSILYGYLKKYRVPMIAGISYIVLTNLFQLATPLVTARAIDSLKTPVLSQILINCAILVGLAFISGIFRYLMRDTLIGVSRKIEYEMRNDYYAHLQKMSSAFFQHNKTGELMALATNDLNAVRNLLGPGIMYSINTIVTTIIAVSVMLSIDPTLTLWAMMPFPFVVLVLYHFINIIHERFRLIQEQFSTLTARAQENISGIRVIKSYVQENHEIQKFQEINKDLIRRNLSLAKLDAFLWGVIPAIIGIGVLIVLWQGGLRIIAGKTTVGYILAFIMYQGLLAWPMMALGWVANLLQRGKASMERIYDIMETEPIIRDLPDVRQDVQTIAGSIEFKNVSFAYDGNAEPVLKNINLKLPAGKTVAIVGHTGSGKTTLINLIPRLYDVSRGKLLIDGQDVRKIPLEVLRRNIGLVPQETFLFSETLHDNIAFGVQETSIPEIQEAAMVSRINVDLDQLPQGMDTMLGERGVNLSGGQKQRTAISRAVIRKPKILILDDAMSAVDTFTEKEILNRLRPIMRDRTSIIISHRTSTVKDADLIVVLEEGQIAEMGNHDQLMDRNGIYRELYEKQLLEESLEEL